MATVRFQETLRRLAMIDEGFVENEAQLGMGPVTASVLEPKTAALPVSYTHLTLPTTPYV